MSTGKYDAILGNNLPPQSMFKDLFSNRNLIIGGASLATLAGVYGLYKMLNRNRLNSATNKNENLYSSQVDSISQYMDQMNASGIKITKTGRSIVNYGNTCFLNSTLQALSSLPLLINFISSLRFSQKGSADEEIVKELMSILIDLNADDKTPGALRPERLIELLKDKFDLGFDVQQDSHEVVVRLLSAVNDIAEATRVSTQTFNCRVDDFGGKLLS